MDQAKDPPTARSTHTCQDHSVSAFDLDLKVVRRILSYRYAFIVCPMVRMRRARRDALPSPADERRFQQFPAERVALLLSYVGHPRKVAAAAPKGAVAPDHRNPC
jgi:hypothetical protein